MGLFEGIVVPVVLYGCKAWAVDDDLWMWVNML